MMNWIMFGLGGLTGGLLGIFLMCLWILAGRESQQSSAMLRD